MYVYFQDQLKGLHMDLSTLEDELDTMKPPGRDIKTVHTQQDEIAKFINKVHYYISVLMCNLFLKADFRCADDVGYL